MLIIGAFEHSIELEEALSVLENRGILRKSIMVVPMDTDSTKSTQYISRSWDRYNKAIEVGMAVAPAGAVIGMSIGLVLKWGPVFWALILAFAGFAIGLGIYLFVNKSYNRHLPKKLPEVTVIVQCSEDRSMMVMETMRKYHALTVGHINEARNE
ncbi:MAG: hypothetical protein Q8942_00540 [Bacillota bacterium]|nr:hypothetical protein [Bacillota bacterium]